MRWPCIGLRVANPGVARGPIDPGQQLLCRLHVRFLGIAGRSGNGASRTAPAQLPAKVFTRPFSFPSSDGMGVDRDGLSRAKSLLGKAGYRVVDGLMVNDAGEPFRDRVSVLLAGRPAYSLALHAFAVDTGHPGGHRMIDRTSYYNRRRNADYDATLVGGGIEVPPSWEYDPFFIPHRPFTSTRPA